VTSTARSESRSPSADSAKRLHATRPKSIALSAEDPKGGRQPSKQSSRYRTLRAEGERSSTVHAAWALALQAESAYATHSCAACALVEGRLDSPRRGTTIGAELTCRLAEGVLRGRGAGGSVGNDSACAHPIESRGGDSEETTAGGTCVAAGVSQPQQGRG